MSDPAEREARAVASRLSRATAPAVESSRQPGPIRERPRSAAVPAAVVAAAQRGGTPLEERARQTIEQQLGEDLGDVRVHDDARADKLRKDLGARAFAVGQDIFVSRQTARARQGEELTLLAHEVVHTVQQRGGEPELQLAEVAVAGGKFVTESYVAYNDGASVGAEMSLKFVPLPGKLPTALGVASVNNIGACSIDLVQIVREIHPAGAAAVAAPGGNAGFAQRQVPLGQPGAGWGIDMEWMAPADVGFAKIANARLAALQARINVLTLLGAGATLAQQAELADLQQTLATDRVHKKGALSGPLTSLDPRYAQQRLSENVPRYTTYTQTETNGNAFVWNGQPPFPASQFARLRDRPGVPIAVPMLGMQFEVVAVLDAPGLAPPRRYLGSVSWGWQRPAGALATAKPALDAFAAVGQQPASADFLGAVAHWNNLTVQGPGVGPAVPVMQL